jgi:hypothetical protein
VSVSERHVPGCCGHHLAMQTVSQSGWMHGPALIAAGRQVRWAWVSVRGCARLGGALRPSHPRMDKTVIARCSVCKNGVRP